MARQKTEAAQYKRVTLRLPQETLEVLQEQAEDLHRNFNTHLRLTLEYGAGIAKSDPLSGALYVRRRPKKS